MCTVSYYRDTTKTIITSNRDEHVHRPLAHPPEKHSYNDKVLMYPQDPKAGGTWFVANASGCVSVLLNGAETKHSPEPPYRKSRGLILLDIFSSSNFNEGWNSIDLSNIEPFTVISYDSITLTQFRWNGRSKVITEFNPQTPHIWSSSTLYTAEVIQTRKSWFNEFINQNSHHIDADNLIDFHTNTQSHDPHNGLIINRDNRLFTHNITQYVLENNQCQFRYFDLIRNFKTNIAEPLQ